MVTSLENVLESNIPGTGRKEAGLGRRKTGAIVQSQFNF